MHNADQFDSLIQFTVQKQEDPLMMAVIRELLRFLKVNTQYFSVKGKGGKGKGLNLPFPFAL